MSLNITDKSFHKIWQNANDEIDAGNLDEIKYNDKIKVECICPKCGQKHKLNLHWIGRGIPRKYCHACKINN